MKKQKELKQSETITINRSQINFAPYNPKVHSKEAIGKQKKNFLEVGFLGGIVWNENTGNLISGHKRIMAMDLYFEYDGTTEKDYHVKVESVNLTDKQEKEQNIYMDARGTNTQQDLNLIAEMLPDIDYKLVGLDDNDLNLIAIESPIFSVASRDMIKADYGDLSQSMEAKKKAIKEEKKRIQEKITEDQQGSHIILSFDSYANKCEFLERLGFDSEQAIIKGEVFSDLIEKKE